MATLIIKPNPLKNEKEIREISGNLIESLVAIYPNGFPTTVRVYKDIPTEDTEIDLSTLKEDIQLCDDDIYWLCMFPQGLEVGVFLLVAAVGAVGYKQYADNANAQQDLERLEEELEKLSNTEVVEETDADAFLPGVGNSSNNVISSQSNLIRLGQKIPQIYGYVRSFPDLIGDAYDYYDNLPETIGNQTLEQYFAIGSGKVSIENSVDTTNSLSLPVDFRIGNQPINLSDIATLNNDGSYEIYAPGEQFHYNDYISNYDSSDIKSCYPSMFRGNCCVCNPGYDSGVNLSISIVTDAAGRGKITIQSNDVVGNSEFGPYGIFIALANGNYKRGDRLRLFYRSSFLGSIVNGTFRTLGHRMGYIPNSPGNHFIEFDVYEATGDYLNDNTTISFSSGRIMLGNETGTLRGNYFWDGTFSGTTGNPGLVLPSNRTDFFPLNKRKQEGTLNEFIIINLDFPRGFDIKRGSRNVSGNPSFSTYEVRFEIQVVEIDDNANIIGNIGPVLNASLKIPTNATRYTIKYPSQNTFGSVAGRSIGVLVTRVDDIYPRFTPFLSTDAQDITIPTTIEARYVDVGYLVERPNYINEDATIIKLTRLNERGSEKKATGQFNFKCSPNWDEYFNFDTGEWVTFIPNHPNKFALLSSWHQAFMRHANKVGNIPIESIDWESLKEINDELRLELPPDPVIPFNLDNPRFDFTFSNKGTPLDEELELICNSVRVSMYKEGSMYRFSRDASKPKVGNITSRNTSIDSNNKTVKFSMPNTYDGIELEYLDGNTDKSAFVYIPEDRSATRPKRIFLSGVTRYPYAWRRANYEYLKLFSQRVGRAVLTTKEAMLWDLLDRITVYDHTRLVVKPLSESEGFFRQETEVQYKDGDWLVGSEKLIADGNMAIELNLDSATPSALGVLQNVPIEVDVNNPVRFRITGLPSATITEIMNQIRTVDNGFQIGERVFVYPISITDKQLIQDDYIILSKYPEGEMVRLELVRYNEDLYQFDNQLPS